MSCSVVHGIPVGSNTKWNNPYKKFPDRIETLTKYSEYIREEISKNPSKFNLKELVGKTLLCDCNRKYCHTMVLQRIVTEYMNQLQEFDSLVDETL
jgi:hypothetical protein